MTTVTFEMNDFLIEEVNQLAKQQNLNLGEFTANLYRNLIKDKVEKKAENLSQKATKLDQVFGKYQAYAEVKTATVEEMNASIATYFEKEWEQNEKRH